MNKTNSHNQFSQYCIDNNVTPIISDNFHTPPTLTKAKRPQQININYDVMSNSAYEIYGKSFNEFCNDGQIKVIKDLKNNKYHILATLDLHNYTQSQAIIHLNQFIDNNVTHGNTCIKIIHGKGLNSNENKPVLKHMVRRMLEHHPRLLAYSSGSINQGGDGITLVKFKSK